MKTGTYKRRALGGLLKDVNPWALGASAAVSLVGGIASAANYKPTLGGEKHLGDYLANTGGNPLNLIPELIKMNKDKNTVVSGSPGSYATGGPIEESQVKTFDRNKLKAVQMDLKAKKLYEGKIDGVYGPMTEKAIRGYNRTAQGVQGPEFTVISSNNPTKLETLKHIANAEEGNNQALYKIWERANKPTVGTGADISNYTPRNNTITLGSKPFDLDSYAGKDKRVLAMRNALSTISEEDWMYNIPKSKRDSMDAVYDDIMKNPPADGLKADYGDLISELSHSYQRRTGRLPFTRGVEDWVRSPYINREQQLKQYDIPGSVEYEAHDVIEPKLKSLAKSLPKDYKISYATGGPIGGPYTPVVSDPKVTLRTQPIQETINTIYNLPVSELQNIQYPKEMVSPFILEKKRSTLSKERFIERANGGDIPLSSNTFQVKGNPEVTDGNKYNIDGTPVKLDHNEVVDTDRNFVFSDDLKIGKKSFADMAVKPNKAIGKAEKILAKNPYDEQAKKTIEFSNRNLKSIASTQEKLATMLGMRQEPEQALAGGGPIKKRRYKPGAQDPYMDYLVTGDQTQFNKEFGPYAHPKTMDELAPINMLTRQQPIVGPDAGYGAAPTQITQQRTRPLPTIPGIDTTSITDVNSTDTSNGMTTGDYLQFAEVGSKFFQTLQGPEEENQILDNTRITKNSYDVRPQLYQSQRSYQNAANSIDSPSLNLRRAMTNNLYAGKLNNDAQTITQYDNMNKQANSQYEEALSNQRRYNIQSTQYTNNLNAANRGAYDSVVQNAYTSLGNLGEALNKRKYGQDALKVLKTRYPEVYNGVVEELFGKKGGK